MLWLWSTDCKIVIRDARAVVFVATSVTIEIAQVNTEETSVIKTRNGKGLWRQYGSYLGETSMNLQGHKLYGSVTYAHQSGSGAALDMTTTAMESLLWTRHRSGGSRTK